MDVLKKIQNYNLLYDHYRFSPIKCIINGKLKQLQWLEKNKYPLTLFDKEFCYCDRPYWMYRVGDISHGSHTLNPDNCCGHCYYVSITSLIDFAIKENQEKIIKWIEKLNYKKKQLKE
jgi:hypothetical protein